MTTDNNYTFREPVRCAFVSVFDPKKFKKNGKDIGEAKFQTTFLIPEDSTEIPAIKAAIAAVARAKWPDRPLTELKMPLVSGKKKADKAAAKSKDGKFYLGNLVLTARTQYPPVLNVLDKGSIVTLDSDMAKAKYKGKFYSGAIMAGEVKFVAYEGDEGADGVTAYLQSLLWVKDGERIGGKDQSETYRGYVGQKSDDDPDDDEVPF